ncbi:MAG: hypothetical protein WC375_04770 [Methanomassiliicoccales archaeon]
MRLYISYVWPFMRVDRRLAVGIGAISKGGPRPIVHLRTLSGR